MERKELTCIGCPLGCSLKVEVQENGEMIVSGNTCPNGEKYAKKELTDPRRIVTSTVKVTGGTLQCVSVKTKSDIPKGKIMECMKALSKVTVKAPVQIGDVLVKNIVETGVDIVATKSIGKAISVKSAKKKEEMQCKII